tara:strand:+ start:1295 stop:1585 length:291 start_codon:yes stop_codon:yes gene_type:complete
LDVECRLFQETERFRKAESALRIDPEKLASLSRGMIRKSFLGFFCKIQLSEKPVMKKLMLCLFCLTCLALTTSGCSGEPEEGVTGDTTPTPEYTDP